MEAAEIVYRTITVHDAASRLVGRDHHLPMVLHRRGMDERILVFTHSIVSPVFARISAGIKVSPSIVTVTVSARAGIAPAAIVTTMTMHERCRAVRIARPLFELSGNMLGVNFMPLKDRQAGLEQVLQVRVLGGRDQQCLQRAIDLLVIRDLVVDIGFIEGGALQFG
jgi:hypothetical protein